MILNKVQGLGQVAVFIGINTQKQQKVPVHFFLLENTTKSSFCLSMLTIMLLTLLLASKTVQEESFLFLLLALPTTHWFSHLIPSVLAVSTPFSSSAFIFELFGFFLTFYFFNISSLPFIVSSTVFLKLSLISVFFNPLFFP